MIWNRVCQYVEYAGGYFMLKLARTLLLSLFLVLLLLLLRNVWDMFGRTRNAAGRLYGKACMWLVLLPVPFLGGLKLSFEHFHIRNRLYAVMYECIAKYPIVPILYFSGMAIVALILFIRKRRLRAWMRRLPLYQGPLPDGCGRRFRPDVRIRTTTQFITPFTTGVFRPVIVLPEYMFEQFDGQELRAVLAHEYCHIRRGHLLVYVILDLLRILWYINPLSHVCARIVKNDLELICDHEVIQKHGYDPEHYGMTLLKSIAFVEKEPEGVPAFFRETSFSVMKKRMRAIARYRAYPKRQMRMLYVFSGIVLIVLSVAGYMASYPAYTPFGGYALYSMDGTKRIIGENEAFNAAVEESDAGLIVDNRKVKELLEDAEIYNDKGEYWIYYGGYMKMPGIGGGGDLLYYSTESVPEGKSLLPYNETDRWSDCLEWVLQHM